MKLTKNVAGIMAIVAIIMLYFVNTLVYTFMPKGYELAYYLVSGTLLLLVAVVVPMLLGYNVPKNLGVKNKLNLVQVALCFLLGLTLMVFGLGYSNILYQLLQLIGYTNISVLPEMGTAFTIVLGVVGLCVLPALGEEFLVRGGILHSLKNSIGTKKAVLMVALFFALMHGSISQLGHQFLVGLACGLVVVVGRSIWYGVIIHFVNNAVTVGLSIIESQNALQIVPTPAQFFSSPTFWVCLGLIVIGLVGAYFIMRYFIKREIPENTEKGIFKPLKSLDNEVVFDVSDRVQTTLFYASMIAFGVLVVVDFVVVMCGGVL